MWCLYFDFSTFSGEMSNADSRIPEKIEDSVIREKYVCDGKLNCQIRCPMCPSKILPIKSAKLVEFSKNLPGKENCLRQVRGMNTCLTGLVSQPT